MDMKGLGETRPELNLVLMGEFLREAVERDPGLESLNPGLRMATGIGHKRPVGQNVISDARFGRPHVTARSWRRLAEPLGWDREVLITVGEEDWAELRRMGVPAGLIGWTQRLATRMADGSNPDAL